MSFLAWIVPGLVAGFTGSKLVNRKGEGILLDILPGVVGAMAGGWLFHLFGAAGAGGLNLSSLFVAVIGSVAFLVTYRLSDGFRSQIRNKRARVRGHMPETIANIANIS